MRLRGGKITINELDSINGLVILYPNHFRINNLRSFLQNALQEYLQAILRVSGHLEIDLSITTHEFNYILNFILDEYNFSDWFLNIELEIIQTAPNRFRICKQAVVIAQAVLSSICLCTTLAAMDSTAFTVKAGAFLDGYVVFIRGPYFLYLMFL